VKWVTSESLGTPKKRGTLRKLITAVALTLMVFGASFIGNQFYDFYHPEESETQAQEVEEVTEDWAQDAQIKTNSSSEQTEFKNGETVGILKIPRLGDDYSKTIVFGVSADDLKKGTGLYPSNALPGEEGNMAIAGHRTGPDETFYDLPAIKEGDKIIIETKDYVYTYKTVKRAEDTEVMDTDTWVLDKPKVSADSTHNLTLTTCAELYPNSPKRLALFAELDSKKEKA